MYNEGLWRQSYDGLGYENLGQGGGIKCGQTSPGLEKACCLGRFPGWVYMDLASHQWVSE